MDDGMIDCEEQILNFCNKQLPCHFLLTTGQLSVP